jgi:hypothetical protein
LCIDVECFGCLLQLLLGYLPPDPSEWDAVLARKRTQYLLFCEVSGAVSMQTICVLWMRKISRPAEYLLFCEVTGARSLALWRHNNDRRSVHSTAALAPVMPRTMHASVSHLE